MSITVELPALGESVVEGTVSKWLVAEGEIVAVDQPLLEITTDKVDAEIPSPVAGRIEKILASEGDTVAVGGGLAIIDTDAAAAVTPAVPKHPARRVRSDPFPGRGARTRRACDTGRAAHGR